MTNPHSWYTFNFYLFKGISKFSEYLYIGHRTGCETDSGCSGNEECIHGTCQLVCHETTCGHKAECEAKNHYALCKCPKGYVGNPYIVCLRGKNVVSNVKPFSYLPFFDQLPMVSYTFVILHRRL